jgi:hypothetical protein
LLCHSWLDQESSLFSWIPAFAGMTLCLVNYGLLSKCNSPFIGGTEKLELTGRGYRKNLAAETL